MTEMIITSSVLILWILILRRLIGGRVSMRFRYTLWLVAAVRLMVPVNVGSSPLSVLNLVPDVWQEYDAGSAVAVYPDAKSMTGSISDVGYADDTGNCILPVGEAASGEEKETVPEVEAVSEAAAVPEVEMVPEAAAVPEAAPGADTVPGGIAGQGEDKGKTVLVATWLAGILLAGGYMTIMQMRFVRYLYRNRETVSLKCVPDEWEERLTAHGMKLYRVKGLSSPCLVGRNIYVDTRLCEEKDRLPHILAHEYCHARQYDTLWALLRSVLTAVYWFHPCVWVAAYAAKQDSELACDEAAIRLLGEMNRYEYGRTLLYLLQGGSNKIGYAGVILTMDGRKRGIRERVSMIAAKHGRKKWAAVAAGIMTCVFCGCAFTGANGGKQPENVRAAEETASKTQTEDISSKEEEIKRLAEENAILEKENAKLSESLEEMQKQLSEIKQMEAEESSAEEQRRKQLKTKAEEDEAFQRSFRDTDIRTIMQNKEIDKQAYGKYYLGETKECPLENGTWYILQNDASGIALYGLYTEDYGCYGIATLIDGDMNFFLEEWLPSIMIHNIEVLEWAEDELPRMFAFRIPQTNTGTSDISRLYVADRYDTGHIELYSFAESDYRKQFEDKMDFDIQQNLGQIRVGWEQDMEVGEIDVSAFEDYVIEDVIWEGDPLGFQFDDMPEDAAGQSGTYAVLGSREGQLTMSTGIGLKLQGRDEVWYNGLPVLTFPVNIGEWGEHKMTIGAPTLEALWVSKPQTALPDVEEKMGITPIHLTESED